MFASKIYIGGGSMPKPTLDRSKILLLLLLFNPSPLTPPPVMMPLHFTLLNNSSFLLPHGFAISFWCPLSRKAIQPHQQPCLGTSSCQKRRAESSLQSIRNMSWWDSRKMPTCQQPSTTIPHESPCLGRPPNPTSCPRTAPCQFQTPPPGCHLTYP